MNSRIGHLFSGLPNTALSEELTEVLQQTSTVRIERIVSTGQASPAGFWYEQSEDEWVCLLRGTALLRLADVEEPYRLQPGDHLFLPAGCRHRVDWTAPEEPTVWLAVFSQAIAK